MFKILAAVLVIGAGLWFCKNCNRESYVSQHQRDLLNPEEWWGPNELKGKQDTSVKPFQIKFGDEMVKDLKYRLKNRRPFTPPLEGIAFEYGFNSGQLDSWLDYWADKYPFADREKFLNQFPQLKTNIQGLDIHFIRVKPQVAPKVHVVPLLLIHGWPGSVREFYDAIPLLTKQTPGYNFAFEVIVPSLPGYGFSDAPIRPGLGAAHIAVVFRNLMHRLGFKQYYVQGGDWGARIASALATFFPEDILGHHSNMATSHSRLAWFKTFVGAFIPSLVVEPHLADRMYPLTKVFAYALEEFGYAHLQATKPDSVGVALTDSPAGLLAYVLEKFASWTVRGNRYLPDGGLVTGGKFTREQLIDNLMIYWTSNCITTSMRLYAETLNKKHEELGLETTTSAVPTWVVFAKNELTYQPAHIMRIKYPNLVNMTVLDDGGHFLAFELPQVFVADVFRAVNAFRYLERVNEQKEEL